jgi:AcrR family transcriptional regulator
MARSARLSMSELRARTAAAPATVHHYLRLGLLPRPEAVASNRFLYDERHVQRLRLIRQLRDRRGLSLAAIRQVLPDLVELAEDQAFRPEMWDRVVGRRLAAESRRTPQALLLQAAKEAFSRHGYSDVGVDELCRAAGQAKGSFYRHYASKEELFLAAAASAAGDVASELREIQQRRRVGRGEVAETLASLLAPRLALFLELVARGIQGRPGYREPAREILDGLAQQAASVTGSSRRPEAGIETLGRALVLAAASILSPPVLASSRAT